MNTRHCAVKMGGGVNKAEPKIEKFKLIEPKLVEDIFRLTKTLILSYTC